MSSWSRHNATHSNSTTRSSNDDTDDIDDHHDDNNCNVNVIDVQTHQHTHCPKNDHTAQHLCEQWCLAVEAIAHDVERLQQLSALVVVRHNHNNTRCHDNNNDDHPEPEPEPENTDTLIHSQRLLHLDSAVQELEDTLENVLLHHHEQCVTTHKQEMEALAVMGKEADEQHAILLAIWNDMADTDEAVAKDEQEQKEEEKNTNHHHYEKENNHHDTTHLTNRIITNTIYPHVLSGNAHFKMNQQQQQQQQQAVPTISGLTSYSQSSPLLSHNSSSRVDSFSEASRHPHQQPLPQQSQHRSIHRRSISNSSTCSNNSSSSSSVDHSSHNSGGSGGSRRRHPQQHDRRYSRRCRIITLPLVTEEDLQYIPRETRGRIFLSTINDALMEVQAFARTKENWTLRNHPQPQRRRSLLQLPISHRATTAATTTTTTTPMHRNTLYKHNNTNTNNRFNHQHNNDYTTTNNRSVEYDDSSSSAVTVTEQELRQSCTFFKAGEATARALLLILCRAHRLRQVPGGKNGLVCYRILPPPPAHDYDDTNNTAHDNNNHYKTTTSLRRHNKALP